MNNTKTPKISYGTGSILLGLITIVVALALPVVSMLLMDLIRFNLLCSEDFILYQSTGFSHYLPYIFEFQVLVIAYIVFIKRRRKQFNEVGKDIIKFNKLTVSIIAAVNIILFVIAAFNFVELSDNEIKFHTILSPSGKEFSYDDVKKVDVGFREKKVFMRYGKGDFYYEISMKDKQTFDLYQARTNEAYDDSYDYLVVFDEMLMNKGIEKTTDGKDAAPYNYEQKYIDQFKGIIDNKKAE